MDLLEEELGLSSFDEDLKLVFERLELALFVLFLRDITENDVFLVLLCCIY